MSRRNAYLATNAVVLGWIVLAVAAVFAHRAVDQPLWLMVHVPLLGAATAAILIWSQHFADTLLRRGAPGARIGLAVRLGLHTAGTAVVIAGMLGGARPLIVVGASTVAASVLAHAVLLAVQLRRALPARFAPLVRYYVAASIVFLAGIAVGALLGVARDPGLTDRLLTSHIVLAADGWIGLTVLGTLVLLWPTVLHARMAPSVDTTARRALPVLLAGLGAASVGPVLDVRPLVAAGMGLWIAGALMIGREGWRQARAMPPGSFAAWSLMCAYGWMLVAAIVLGVQALTAPDWATLRADYLVALGPLVAGFGVQVLIGSLSHLLPVVALGSPAAARAGAGVLDRAAAFRVAGFNGAIALSLLPMPSIARVLLSFVAVGMGSTFVVLAVRALVVGRRVRRSEGVEPDRSRVVAIGMPQRPQPRRPAATSVAAAFAVLMVCVGAGVAADPAATGISTVGTGGAGAVVASGHVTEATVRVQGMRYEPAVIEVPVGDELVVTFENTGTDVHDLTFATGARTARLAPGASETVSVGLVGADLAGWCSIAGHRQMGMELAVVATGAPIAEAAGPGAGSEVAGDGADGSHGDSHTGSHPDAVAGADAAGADDAASDIDLQRDPGDGFAAHPARLAPAGGDLAPGDPVVHRATLRVSESVAEVAPGIQQTRWSFGGTSPGPVLRGRIGDTFEITLVNDGSIGHSIDFHAGALAPNEPMRTIAPGERLVYTFTATRAGIWMYHCSTMPMSMHIANGMYGAVVIDPPDLAPVDREYLLVQGELYLGAQGDTADADKIAAVAPDLVAFNGYADQYRYRPLAARAGERVRVWVLDAGPNTPTVFHVVGGQFDTVYLEGAYTLRPDGTGGSQALALQPAQGGFVELVFPEPGDYTFVTHRMTDAERGAAGSFHVE